MTSRRFFGRVQADEGDRRRVLRLERLRIWQRYQTMIELHGHKPAVLVPQRNTLPLDTAKPSRLMLLLEICP